MLPPRSLHILYLVLLLALHQCQVGTAFTAVSHRSAAAAAAALVLDQSNVLQSTLILPASGGAATSTFDSSTPLKATSSNSQEPPFTHSDIEWRLRPQKGTQLLKRISLRAASNLIKLDCLIRRKDAPPVLCPKGGQAVLQAYYRPPGSTRKKQIARFGISTVRGPPAPPIDDTATDIFGIEQFPLGGIGVAAIVYMFVEKEYRKRGIGELALEVISAIHAVQGCDFTVLVADDNGSGKLVEWYEAHGFKRAPKLQDMMGSPGGKFGTTMIAPTTLPFDFFDRCKINW